MRKMSIVLAALAAMSLPLAAQSPDPNLLPPYKPDVQIHGTVRVFGGNLKGLVEVW